MVETVKSWQLMTRGSAQAGNRAGKTERYLQWLESRPEWHAVTSAGVQLVQLHPFCIHLGHPQRNCAMTQRHSNNIGGFGRGLLQGYFSLLDLRLHGL